MVIGINLKDNIDAVVKDLNAVQRREVPHVTARALTAVAFDGQRAVKADIRKKYILRNRWTESGVRVTRANKVNLTAYVFMFDGRQYMTLQEEGGTIRSASRHIAVPQRVRRSKRSKITKARRPRQLLSRPNVFKIDRGSGSHLPPGIYQRMKNGTVKLLYSLEPSVRIERSFGMEKTVIGIVTIKFASRFVQEFNKAMRD